MISASIDTRPLQPALLTRIQAHLDRFRQLFSEQMCCAHGELVFDEINDVHCRHCGQDFTD